MADTHIRSMQRITIIGSAGAGKSTLASRLHKKLHLPLIHLDAHFWNPNWVETDRETWLQDVRRMVSEPRWIMDGNFGSAMDIRFAHADTIIFLDLPRLLCTVRVLRRIITGKRADCIPGCREAIEWEFFKWIWNFPRTCKPGILDKLSRLPQQKRVVHLRSQRDVETFLRTLEPPMPTHWRQQHHNNSCASACLAMLLSQRGMDRQDTDVIIETGMQRLLRLDDQHEFFEAGVLMQEPEVFDIMLNRYGLRFTEHRVANWEDSIVQADNLLSSAQPFMIGVNPSRLPSAKPDGPQGGSHAIVVHRREGDRYHCFNPDTGLARNVEHPFADVADVVSFTVTRDELHELITSRGAEHGIALAWLEPAGEAPDETAPLMQESLRAAQQYETVARGRLDALRLVHGAPHPDDFYSFIIDIVKPFTNDFYTALQVSGLKHPAQQTLADTLSAFKQRVIGVQRNIAANSLTDWESEKADLLLQIGRVQPALLAHLRSKEANEESTPPLTF